MSLKDKVCVVGIGRTLHGRIPGRSPLSFMVEAAKKALDDAGLRASDLDGVVTRPMLQGGTDISPWLLAQYLGMPELRFASFLSGMGASGGVQLEHAAMAIDAGLAHCVLIAFGDDGFSRATGGPRMGQAARGDEAAYGFFGAPGPYAMCARRHMYQYGTKKEQLGAIAVAFRQWALLNPDAEMHSRPMTLEDYLNSPLVCEPLSLPDCCLVSDGGVALIVTSAGRARDLRHRPIYLMGMGQGFSPGDIGNRPDLTVTGAALSGPAALRMAGITPKDVDVCQIYDCFTITVLVTLEDYGFCPKGEGGAFVEDGKLGPGGSLPSNTSGGNLSDSYLQTWGLICEAVQQLRGEGGPRQVKDAEIALVSGQGGTLHSHSTMIFRR